MVTTKKLKNAVLWTSIEAASNVLLSIISIVYLARILNPADFGKIATAQVIESLLTIFLSLGLTEAFIQKETVNDITKSTVFLATVSLSFISVIISIFVTIYLFYALNDSVLSLVYIFESMASVLNLLSILPTAILTRNMQMASFTKRTLVSRLLFFIVAIPCAIHGFGIWSIVSANFVQVLSSTFFIFFAVKNEFPRKYIFNYQLFKDLVRFGFFIMVENILWSVISRVLSLLVGVFHGVSALGIYNMATRVTDAITNVLNIVIGRMALPMFSRQQHSTEGLKLAFTKATMLFNVLSMPLFIGIAITAKNWVPLILGIHWLSAIPLIQIISCMNAVMFSRIFVGTMVKAVGRSKDFMLLSLCAALLAVITMIFTRNNSLDISILSWALVRVSVTIYIGYVLIKKIMGFKFKDQFSPIVLPLFSTIIMVFFSFWISSYFDSASYSKTIELLVTVLTSVIIYISVLALLYYKVIKNAS